MSDKISQALWKAFVLAETKNIQPKVEIDDRNLLKSLANLDRTDERKPGPRLEALDELVREIPRQVVALAKLKKPLGDKPFGKLKDKLHEILEEAETLQKKTRAALDAEDDEDEDSAPSALVDTRLLVKQLTMCRKDPELRMKFAFVDGKDRQPAMLALHPRSSARALFARLQAAAGVKTGAFGLAWMDGTTLMLQLEKPLSGLVKKVRAPVKACGFKIAKAVLWNEDGTVFEQDESSEDAVGDGLENPAPNAQASPSESADSANGAPPAPPQPSVTYEATLGRLLPPVRKAIEQGHGAAAKLQAILSFAQTKAAANDFLGAVAALRQLEKLLDSPAREAAPGGVEEGAAFKARMTSLVATLKEAQAEGLAQAGDAKLKASEAALHAGKRDFAQANALLDEAEALIDDAREERTHRRLRERVLVANANRAHADYLTIRDTSQDLEAVVDSLSGAEALWQAWQDEFGDEGDASVREEMELLEQKLEVERQSVTDLLDRLVKLEALIAQRDAEADPDRRVALQVEMNDSLEDLAA